MSDRVIIFDTTLRDGEQSPGASMNTAEKLRLAVQLEKLGVDVLEAGFPAASDGDFEAVSKIAAKLERTQVAGLCRANRNDIDRAWQAVASSRHSLAARGSAPAPDLEPARVMIRLLPARREGPGRVRGPFVSF